MNEELRDLLSLGTGIVRLSSHSSESASGHVETETNRYACRIDGKPCEIEVRWTTHFLKGAGTSFKVHERRALTEDEYGALAAGEAQLDSAQAVAELRAQEDLAAQLRALTPKCSQCGSRMTQRSGKHGEFWGCPRFPKCNGTQSISAEYRALARGMK